VLTVRALPRSSRLVGRAFPRSIAKMIRGPVLTPVPMNETYSRHAYLARYLASFWVEGEELNRPRGRALHPHVVCSQSCRKSLVRRLDGPTRRIRSGSSAFAVLACRPCFSPADARCDAMLFGSGVAEARAVGDFSFWPALAPPCFSDLTCHVATGARGRRARATRSYRAAARTRFCSHRPFLGERKNRAISKLREVLPPERILEPEERTSILIRLPHSVSNFVAKGPSLFRPPRPVWHNVLL